ncbi:MAG: Rubrerythrin [Methanomassiliicoccales archaeon PtaU1.Bin124]|nr:MAG: Rubrerythrin [Methanomassiliicoccales archaeon PtaU1.Bin124]
MSPNDPAKLSEQLSILQAAVEIEEFGIKFYGKLESCVAEEEGKALMRALARDEATHRELLLKEIDRLMKNGGKVEPDNRYIDIVPEKVFAVLPKDRCLTVKEEVEILEVGMGVERKSIEMYTKAANNAADPDVKRLLVDLSHIEEGHLKLLQENAYNLRMEGSWYGYSPILEG